METQPLPKLPAVSEREPHDQDQGFPVSVSGQGWGWDLNEENVRREESQVCH